MLALPLLLLMAAGLAAWNPLPAQRRSSDPDVAEALPPADPDSDPTAATSSAPPPATPPGPATAGPSQPAAERTGLNLLGEVNTARGESRRNENVRLTLIDNYVLAELNERMGTTATLIQDFKVDQGYWGTEFGGQTVRSLHLPPAPANQIHGNIFWSHDNSVLRARKFFHVGEVLPARRNDYGFTVSLPLWKGAAITVNGSKRKDR